VTLTSHSDFGLPGVTLEPGDHICAMYLGAQERQDLVNAFMGAGLAAGDKCICVLDPSDHAAIRIGLGDEVDVDGCIASQQFELMGQADTYLRKGAFSVEEMIDFWDEAVGGATSGGRYGFTRATGDTTWCLDTLDGFDEFARYEAELNRFTPKYPQAILCLYDLSLYGGGLLVELLRTHPKLLIAGMLIDNPHYLSPDESLAGRQ
jgi:hypothetical protein